MPVLVSRLLFEWFVTLHAQVGIGFLAKRLQGFHIVTLTEGFNGVYWKMQALRDHRIGFPAFPHSRDVLFFEVYHKSRLLSIAGS